MHASGFLPSMVTPRRFSTAPHGRLSTSSELPVHSSREDSKMLQRAHSSSIGNTNSGSATPATKPSLPSPVRPCLCSPTSHAGSFRCRLHRGSQLQWAHPVTTPPARAGTRPEGQNHGSSSGVDDTSSLLRFSLTHQQDLAKRTFSLPASVLKLQNFRSPARASGVRRDVKNEKLGYTI